MELSSNSLRILAEIMDCRGFPPTLDELQDITGINSPNGMLWHLKRLGSEGLIRRERFKSRSLVATCKFIPADRL